MSYPTVNAAVAKLLLQSTLKTIDDFIEALKEDVEVDEDLMSAAAKFKDSLAVTHKPSKAKGKTEDGEPKKKRAASLFNIFVRDEMARMKAADPTKNGKDSIKEAAGAWKVDPFALFLQDKTKMAELKSDDSDNELLYRRAKAAFGLPGTSTGTTESSEVSDDAAPPKGKGKAAKAPKVAKAPKAKAAPKVAKGGKGKAEATKSWASEAESVPSGGESDDGSE